MEKNKKREYCETLGIPIDADEEVIKRAYKKLALEYHPDRPNNKGKEEDSMNKFRKVTDAYEKLQSNSNAMSVLKNVLKSQEIHSSLEHFLFTTGNSMNSFQFNSVSCSEFSTPIRSNSFCSKKSGQSLKTSLNITFQECLNGCSKTIEFTRSLVCGACAHSKSSFNTAHFCRDCGGKGVLKAIINGGSLGGSNITTACPTCSGVTPSMGSPGSSSSWNSKDICSSCNGSRKITDKKTCKVDVPPGVLSGTRKVFQGEGDESDEGGIPGNLIVCFEVEPHPFYIRKADDVCCKMPLPFPYAALGTKLEFPSMYGKKLEVIIRPGIQHDEVITIEHEGFFNSEKQHKGSLYLQVSITMPKVLEEKEKKLLQQLATECNFLPVFKCT